MNPSSEERDIRIKEIFEKRGVTTFWGAYSMLTEEAGCSDLVSFEDCIIHFGSDNIFDGVTYVRVYEDDDRDDTEYLVVLKYKTNNIHPKLCTLVDFCKANNIDWSDIDGVSETVKFRFTHDIILEFFKAEFLKYFKTKMVTSTDYHEFKKDLDVNIDIDEDEEVGEVDDCDEPGGLDDTWLDIDGETMERQRERLARLAEQQRAMQREERRERAEPTRDPVIIRDYSDISSILGQDDNGLYRMSLDEITQLLSKKKWG